jgi:hypothetical protein
MDKVTRILGVVAGIMAGTLSVANLYEYYTSPIIIEAGLAQQSADKLQEFANKPYEDIIYKAEPLDYAIARLEIIAQDNSPQEKEIDEIVSTITKIKSNPGIMEDSMLYSLTLQMLGSQLDDYANTNRDISEAIGGYFLAVFSLGCIGVSIIPTNNHGG